MDTAQALLAAGDAHGALEGLQREVREHATDAKRRVFLFQLLCVLAQWQRALTQLQVCGELDAGTLAMVNTYREAVKCELVREAVFEGRTTPMLLGQPPPWVACLVQAQQAQARGDAQAAHALRAHTLEQAEPTPGLIDGQPFEWICDADSRLGPVLEAIINGRYCWVPFAALSRITLEAPEDLRDLVWAPAHLAFPNGGETVALIPTRYPGTAAGPDDNALLARRTDWAPLGDEQFAGVGQRVLCTDAGERDLLQVRTIELRAAAA
jgi:type VI secretion system protein ImpE